jgi:hypothetical protein
MTVNEAELTIYLPDKAPLIARCSNGKDSHHGAEKKALRLGQLYVDPNSLWAPFVTVIVQLLYCLVLCSGFAVMHSIFFYPTKIYMLKSPQNLPIGDIYSPHAKGRVRGTADRPVTAPWLQAAHEQVVLRNVQAHRGVLSHLAELMGSLTGRSSRADPA